MICTRCGKRLSRKTARLIDGEVICSACMFAPASAGRNPQGEKPQALSAKHEHAVTAKPADAQPPSSSSEHQS